MIETKDKRRFMTHEKHLLQLIEFAKTFSANLFLVRSEDNPLEMNDLVSAICSTNYDLPTYHYEIVSAVTYKPKTRKNVIKNAQQIKMYIEDKFKNKEIVCLKELKKKFKKYNLSTAALCNHVKRVKTQIEKQGYKIKKISSGKYSI